MWALVWLILGTPDKLPPSVMLYPTEVKCDAQRKFIDEHVAVLKAKDAKSLVWCVQAMQTESVSGSLWGSPNIMLTPGYATFN